jgi:hypothetical protein
VAPGLKPRVVVQGWILGDRLIVDRILAPGAKTAQSS